MTKKHRLEVYCAEKETGGEKKHRLEVYRAEKETGKKETRLRKKTWFKREEVRKRHRLERYRANKEIRARKKNYCISEKNR